MAKFSSQKGIYDAIYDRERKQKEIEEQVRKIKEENMFRISNELEKQRALFDAKRESQLALEKQYKQYEDALQNPHQHSQYHFRRNGGESEAIVDDNDELGVGSESRKGSRKKAFSADHFVDPNHEKVNRSSVATIASSTKANLLAVEHELAKKKSLMDFKASTIKSLNSSHPEILTKLRCERAVEYVQRMEKKNSRRLSSVATAQPFRPGGSLKPSASTGKVQAASSASCEQASAAVSQPILREELRKTEDMIRLQKLKIGLKRS